MKKRVLAFVGGLMFVPLLASANFSTDFGYGSTGQNVFELQDVLQEVNCLNHPSTGYFGVLTLHAVQCYQNLYDISATGYVGPHTRLALNGYISRILGGIDLGTSTEQSSAAEPTAVIQSGCPSGYTCTPISITGIFIPNTPIVVGSSEHPITNIVTPTVNSTTPFKLVVSTRGNGIIDILSSKEIDLTGSTVTGLNGATATPVFITNFVNSPDNCYGQWRDPVTGNSRQCGISSYSLSFDPIVTGNPDFVNTVLTLKSKDGETRTASGNMSLTRDEQNSQIISFIGDSDFR